MWDSKTGQIGDGMSNVIHTPRKMKDSFQPYNTDVNQIPKAGTFMLPSKSRPR